MPNLLKLSSRLIKRISSASMLAFIVCQNAMAADPSGAMPWEGPLTKIMESLTGPVAKILGVIVIVIAGLGIAFGESGSGVRRLFQVVMGLAIAFTAASIVATLFGS